MDNKLYKMMDWARIEGICYAEDDNPHDFLGAHIIGKALVIQMFAPGVKSVKAVVAIEGQTQSIKMDLMDEIGFYACLVKNVKGKEYSYHFVVTGNDRKQHKIEDPYRFDCTVSDEDIKLFENGIHYNIYDVLGAHIATVDNVKGTIFAVWAPNALRVSVVGDFNNWDGRIHQMRRVKNSGIFEIFIPGVGENEIYKYEVMIKGGQTVLKADPYGFAAQLRPETASKVSNIDDFAWDDAEFVKNRKELNRKDKPMCIYEVYLGSIKRPDDTREYCNYRELAHELIPYVLRMGYTHVELMPVMEHPLDESWGYQVIGYYAPTARYGSPEDFMYFMNEMHKAGIGVILDWVPAHFPRDIQGLSNFDGTCLYEHLDPRKGSHPHWGTLIYNYGRKQVSNYLIANAMFWIEKYHADGIRMDAVASMLYLDYGRNNGEWIPNEYGGHENLEAVELLKHLNSINEKKGTGALMIAEESTAWPKVTGSLSEDGLGFDYKWNMGWMNDFLEFMRLDPLYRGAHFGELTFSMIYAFSEQFMLVFSHDEVVHGKSSMIGKMPGDRALKFANLRLAFGYMFMHPGKKLNFMGQEIAEFDEWNENRATQYELLQYDEHRLFNGYVSELIDFYKNKTPLYELDGTCEGFEWINNISANESVLVFLRKDKKGDNLLIVCNFANVTRENYKIGVPFGGKYKEIFNSDAVRFNGGNRINPRVKTGKLDECDGRDYSIRIRIAPLSISVFDCIKTE